MPVIGVVRGQKVTKEKLHMAKDLRRRMTPEEERIWEKLRNNQFHGLHFRRQQVIDGFVVDFYCHQASLVIEIDGGIHEGQREADAERDAALRAKGLTVLHYRNDDVNSDLTSVLERILACILPPSLAERSERSEESGKGVWGLGLRNG